MPSYSVFGLNERRGRKPRCHSLTHGSADEVSARLTALAAPFAAVSCDDRWMPQGFDEIGEAQLHRAPRLIDPAVGRALTLWWLVKTSENAKTPNFDIASTCTIEGSYGLLLVEAKAHDEELNKERIGKRLRNGPLSDQRASVRRHASANSLANHNKVAAALEAARRGL